MDESTIGLLVGGAASMIAIAYNWRYYRRADRHFNHLDVKYRKATKPDRITPQGVRVEDQPMSDRELFHAEHDHLSPRAFDEWDHDVHHCSICRQVKPEVVRGLVVGHIFDDPRQFRAIAANSITDYKEFTDEA